MVTTTNKFLEKPARGSLSGVWDTPVNANMDVIDASFGGITTIPLLSTGVVLSQPQYQCAFIRFTGNITTDIPVGFPAVGGFWTIINDCTNFNNAVPYCYTGVGNYIGLPPGTTQIMSDGTNMRYCSLPPVGTYMQVASNGYPRWVSLNPAPLPYLNCDGTGFNTTTYARLFEYLGFGTTPDIRGRALYTTDQGTGRLTSTIGSAFTAAGGSQFMQVHSHSITAQLSGYSVDDINHFHSQIYAYSSGAQKPSQSGTAPYDTTGTTNTGYASDSGFALNNHRHYLYGGTDNSGAGGYQNMPPAYIGGLMLIRTGYP